MDPSNNAMDAPSSSFSPLMYNFLSVSPPISPQVPEYPKHCCHTLMKLQKQKLKSFWKEQENGRGHFAVDEPNQLPLARVKKNMKFNPNVKMVSAESPILLSKASELFIQELTLRSWIHTEDQGRRTMLRKDIANGVIHADTLDFLVGVVPIDEA